MAQSLMQRAILPASRSTLRSLPRFNCSRIQGQDLRLSRCWNTTFQRRRIHISPSVRQINEPYSTRDTSEAGPPDAYDPPPPRPFLSYRTAILVVLASSSFLVYRLFFYNPSSDTAPLDPKAFVARHLALKQSISPSLAVFSLSAGLRDAADDLWTQGIWSIEFKQPQLQIAREYTPLPPVKLPEESEGAWSNRAKGLRFLIRRQEQGEVSGYLHGLAEGAKVELRGPTPELILPPDVSEVVFLAGGTGIAPAMQVAYALSRRAAAGAAGSPGRPVHMSILWASRTRADTGTSAGSSGTLTDRYASVPGQLDALAGDARAGGRFELQTRTFVDEEGSAIRDADVRAAVTAPTARPGQPTGRRIVLVSGPDGFVAHVAGAKVSRDGVEEQGAVGGLLGRLDLAEWQVWKL